jgi:hypothetical protein
VRSGKNIPKKDDATTPAGEEDEEGGTVGGFKEAGEALTDTSAQDEPTPAPRSHRRRDSPSGLSASLSHSVTQSRSADRRARSHSHSDTARPAVGQCRSSSAFFLLRLSSPLTASLTH